jgi:CRISPR-associated endoribonuclease Cas6
MSATAVGHAPAPSGAAGPALRRLGLRLAVAEWGGGPATLYGAGHGLFLGLLRMVAPAEAAALHDADRRKPLALGPVRVVPGPGRVARATLEVAVVEAALGDLVEAALPGALEAAIDVAGHPACLLSIERLSAIEPAALLAGEPARVVRVAFVTPTLFSLGRGPGGHRYGLLPEPGLVVGSWLRGWRLAGGETWAAEARPEWLAERVALRALGGVRTATVDSGRAPLTGFLGEASFAWTGPEPWGGRLLRALAAAAAYYGTGAKTGFGFGQTRLIGAAGQAGGAR